MKKVITYGTFDLLHYGHIKLLERAKKLGNYLIVGVTSENFDKNRGKINVKQSLIERVEAVKSTGLADQIIVEEYEGQKIDDIKKYAIDIFTVGSDWQGCFDYLDEYCKVIYLDRTKGISSSQIRSKSNSIRLGIIGDEAPFINKFQREDKYVNGIEIIGICTNNVDEMSEEIKRLPLITQDYDELLKNVDAVYIKSNSREHYRQVKRAIELGKHVLCASPITTSQDECKELFNLAKQKNVVLMEEIRTAYSTAYSRLLLLLKGGKVGKILSVEATCSSLKKKNVENINSLLDWGPTALLPIFQILGTNYKSKNIISNYIDNDKIHDSFTKINFIYNNATASITVAEGAKSEGDLIVTGTEGYIYVPAPWWKTDYFEIRYEDQSNNKRYFYQLDGEGIRYELLAFTNSIKQNRNIKYIEEEVSLEISKVLEEFINKKDLTEI